MCLGILGADVSENVLRTQGKGMLKFMDVINSRLAAFTSKETHQKYKLTNDEIDELNDLLVEYLKISEWKPSPGWTFAITAIFVFGLKQVEALENRAKNKKKEIVLAKKKEAEEKNTPEAQKEYLETLAESEEHEQASIIRKQFQINKNDGKYSYSVDGNRYLKKNQRTQRPPADLLNEVIKPALARKDPQTTINKLCAEYLKEKGVSGYE